MSERWVALIKTDGREVWLGTIATRTLTQALTRTRTRTLILNLPLPLALTLTLALTLSVTRSGLAPSRGRSRC